MIYINKEKLEKIKLNSTNFYVSIDFDRTITNKESYGSWDVAGSKLGQGFKEESYSLLKKYEPIELDYDISFEEKNKAMEEWYNKCLQLYYEFKLTTKKLKDSISNNNIMFRVGAKEFLYNMYINNIPVVILSAGIGNIIEQFLQINDCYYDNIYIISNFLQFDKYGNIKEHEGKLIHTLNKTIEGNLTSQFEEEIKNREYRLLVGDYIEDKNMVPIAEWNKTISVRFFRKRIRKELRNI